MRVFTEAPRRVLALYAHPDDADIAAGGTLAAWAAQGATVDLVIVCDGAKGSLDPLTDVAQLRSQRAQELQAAAQLLGISDVQCLGIPDGEITNSNEFRERLVRLLRAAKPDCVLGPDPTATFFGGVYVNHRDHRELGWALLDAAAPAASMPLYYPGTGVPHQVKTLLLSGTHEPDVVVDITAVIDAKVSAVLAHGSQITDDPQWVRSAVMGRAEATGREVGIRFGEAFRCVELSH
ncbi:MAG: PIG-L family deacetylase [Actinomycetes bacterium]